MLAVNTMGLIFDSRINSILNSRVNSYSQKVCYELRVTGYLLLLPLLLPLFVQLVSFTVFTKLFKL